MNLSHAIQTMQHLYSVYRGHNVRIMEKNGDHTSMINFNQINLKQILQQYIRERTTYLKSSIWKSRYSCTKDGN